MTIWAKCIAATAALWLATGALADSWAPPRVQNFESANHQFRLTVHPRPFSDWLDYFTDKLCGREQAGTPAGNRQRSARAVMERSTAGGWKKVWSGPLANELSPVSALVADDGRHVVTFDNWHSMGQGENVVVIYGARGRLIQSLKLTDLVPEAYVRALPRSVSSIQWSGKHALSGDGDLLVLKVVVPSPNNDGKETIDLTVDLATGRPLPPSGPRWNAALKAASATVDARRRENEERNARFRAPLLGPNSTGEREWHEYLREAFYRTAHDGRGSTSTTVLRLPDASDYAASEKWVREKLTKEYFSKTRSFASPSQDNLAKVMADAAKTLKTGDLSGVQIFLAVDNEHFERIAAALAPSGADLIQHDPGKPIPQRPERLAAADAPPRAAPAARQEACAGDPKDR
ncbi:MAG TPA: hypothetical protein VIT45_02010 [Allosphingosinicella sp.]